MKYTLLLADDEPHARAFLSEIIDSDDSLELIGTCVNGSEVVKFCKTLMPDILLLDIQMPGKNGIDTAHEVSKMENPPLIIFTTAYDQYAIEAFEVFAFGYLLKPFSKQQFFSTIEKAKVQCDQKGRSQFADQMEQLYQRFKKGSATTLEEFEVKEKGLIKRIKTEDINYLSADSEYVQIHTNKEKYMYRASLSQLIDQLPDSFLRIHRSYIINKKHLSTWKYLNNSTYRFHLSNGTELVSSRSYQSEIQQHLA